MKTQKALVSTEAEKIVTSSLLEISVPNIVDGEILIQSAYSGLNFKDALGVTGSGRIFKKFPIVGGIDVSGLVVQSKSKKFKEGDQVLVTGGGLGETHDGGYAEFVKESEINVVLLPKNLSLKEAMIYGTAGFTAALCLERMETNGQTPEKGPILVTGASGGVGQFATSFFKTAGYTVECMTGKAHLTERLKEIGASVIHTDIRKSQLKPLDTVRFGGAVDNVGGTTLTHLLPQIELWGNVASVGLAESHELNSTVMPFILRGVSLLGTSSNNTPWDLRLKIWNRLANDLKPYGLERFVTENIGLDGVLVSSETLLARKHSGRTLITFEET